jgi:gas vesicle protein
MEDSNKLSYFFLGLGIGVAAGILFAPKSGEETRGYLKAKAGEGADYLKTRAGEGRDYLKQRTDEIKESTANLVDRSKAAVDRQREQLAAALEAGKKAYRESVATES